MNQKKKKKTILYFDYERGKARDRKGQKLKLK